MGKARAIVFETTDSGCMIPTNMKLNQDGYFRKLWSDGPEMFHRFIWKARKGDIPEGYEINHLCGNRACQNVEHMECIHGSEHAIKTNKERYAVYRQWAFHEWITTNCSATDLVKTYGWSAYKWVREWKQNLEVYDCKS